MAGMPMSNKSRSVTAKGARLELRGISGKIYVVGCSSADEVARVRLSVVNGAKIIMMTDCNGVDRCYVLGNIEVIEFHKE